MIAMKKKILFRLFLVIFIVSAGLLLNTYYKSYKADKLYGEARDMYYKNIEEVLDEKINKNQEEEPEDTEKIEDSEEVTEEAEEDLSEESEEESYEEEFVQQEPQQE